MTDTGTWLGADVGGEELLGDRLSEHLIHVPQMAPEELVELEVVVGRVVVAVPPEPVAALGNQQLLEGLLPVCRVRSRRDASEHLPGVAELPPAAEVVAVADPDEEVAVDPRAGKDAVLSVRLGRAAASLIVTGRSSGCVDSMRYSARRNGRPPSSKCSHAFSPSRMTEMVASSPPVDAENRRPASTSRLTKSAAATSACQPAYTNPIKSESE